MPTPRRPHARRLAALFLAIALPAAAQDLPAPDRSDPPAIRPTRPGRPSQPARTPGSIPGLEGTDLRIRPPALLREGSFVVRRRGSMVKLPSGEQAFIFHKDADGRAERPMVLIPNQVLQRMEQSAGEKPADAVFAISGEVFAYRGVNYLLATAAAMESHAAPAPSPAPAPAPAAPEQPAEEPAASTAPPEVLDLIARLEAQRDRPRTIDPAVQLRPIEAPAPSAEGGELIPEGRTIVRRRGRMVRSPSGDWSFVFDAGPETDPGKDRPLLLAPGLTLHAMEQTALREGDAATLEVSGRILSYHNRNYLIPTIYQRVRTGDLQPRP